MRKIIRSLRDVSESAWNQLAGANPFLSHEYLSSLEENHCVGEKTGWTPCHIVYYRNDRLIAGMPLYLKTHSYGEYVFDWAWADAYQRNGLDYYPKLISAIPFTPVAGPRLLTNEPEYKNKLIKSALALAEENNLSSFHCLFPHADDQVFLSSNKLLCRETIQFHWTNNKYETFGCYLATMNHKNRKKIKQERRRLVEQNFKFETLSGNEISDLHWKFFYKCYETTYRIHHSTPYLNLNFFLTLAKKIPKNLVLVIASQGGRHIATALNILGGDTLYGRYWGTVDFFSGLHFEVCYYQALEYCIKNGIKFFEGGAQGEHKLSRGLEPVRTFSSHWLAHPQFRNAIDNYLQKESLDTNLYVNELEQHSPFRKKK